MTDLKPGDKVQHRDNGTEHGHIIEIRVTSDGHFRLIRVRWATRPVPAVTWETEENLTLAE
jgi:hypothetical protein